jgi:hypothetical protein
MNLHIGIDFQFHGLTRNEHYQPFRISKLGSAFRESFRSRKIGFIQKGPEISMRFADPASRTSKRALIPQLAVEDASLRV